DSAHAPPGMERLPGGGHGLVRLLGRAGREVADDFIAIGRALAGKAGRRVRDPFPGDAMTPGYALLAVLNDLDPGLVLREERMKDGAGPTGRSWLLNYTR